MTRMNAQTKQDIPAGSLLDAFGAVQSALSELPDDALNIRSPMADAFMVADPVLASLDKQKQDAEAHYKKLVRTYGFADAMTEAQNFQRAAIEEAYNTRLAALRRRKGEQKGRTAHTASEDDAELKLRGQNTCKATQDHLQIQREEERLLKLAQEQQKQKRANDTLWLWVLLFWASFANVDYQQKRAAYRFV